MDVEIPDANAILNKSPTINGSNPINNNSDKLKAVPVLTDIALYKPSKPGM